MNTKASGYIEVVNASENNLKNISLRLPHNQIIVITGVSGSGKSSLAFNILAQSGQKKFLETFSAYTKSYLGKLGDPKVEKLNGITPVVAIAQKTSTANSRSTVGTLLDVFDYFKILYARLAPKDAGLSRAHFSFNNLEGACKRCKGIGLEEFISINKLVANPSLTLREGALVPTLPNGYIVYSQVTVEVLNEVCKAHGFSVDIPWEKLTQNQKNVILNGSQRLKIPYGKHSLASRLKWTGIKSKPRVEGFYKGMLPTMNDILKRDRNKNILRFVEAKTCSSCAGKRYNDKILSQTLNSLTWNSILTTSFSELLLLIKNWDVKPEQKEVFLAFQDKICETLESALALGIGHLSFHRSSESLSGGELQRLRTLNQITSKLSGLTYVFDEPSIGLHPSQNKAMISVFNRLKEYGNTVIVVEHDLSTITQADWIVEIGPLAGKNGGEVVFNGAIQDFLKLDPQKTKSYTLKALLEKEYKQPVAIKKTEFIELSGCSKNNLKEIEVGFVKEGLTCVAGVSGAGKSSLVFQTLVPALKKKKTSENYYKELKHAEAYAKVVVVDQKAIGRTSRSNPATYTGLADKIRDVFSKTADAKKLGLKKSNFSFNTKGGRCEKCLGTGVIEIGMHFLSNVHSACDICNGKRFKSEVLEVKYRGFSISDIYSLSVNEAVRVFDKESAICSLLALLQEIGLGYLSLGQSSTTLSGGEAQRIKLVSELYGQTTKKTVYVLDEPSIGLHPYDLKKLINILRKLTRKGNMIVCVTHNPYLLKQADHILELGPSAGVNGGEVIAKGALEEIRVSTHSKISPYLKKQEVSLNNEAFKQANQQIKWKNVQTNNLQKVDVSVPKFKLTVVIGVSGSGKTSFAIDTLFSEAQSRYAESLSNHVRGKLKLGNQALFDEVNGLTTAIKIDRKTPKKLEVSTVGTNTGIYDALRLLFARIASLNGYDFSAKDFSFNQKSGACLTCEGKGFELKVEVEKIITSSDLSIEDGLFLEHKSTQFYAQPGGQYMAVLNEAAKQCKIDLAKPWNELSKTQQKFILFGDPKKEYTIRWKTKEKEQTIQLPWLGFATYVEHEYARRKWNKNIDYLLAVLEPVTCSNCAGDRLREPQRSFTFLNKTIGEMAQLSIADLHHFLKRNTPISNPEKVVFNRIAKHLTPLLDRIIALGLGYITINRSTHTLSGGEFQRIHLAGQLANKLSGVTYVIDEPTVGLHPKNYEALFAVLEELKRENNTLLVIEHNPEMVKKADHILEFGPAAGKNGGRLIYQGNLEGLRVNPTSIYKDYLDVEYTVRAQENVVPNFGINQFRKYDLPSLSAHFCTHSINALTGLSGSGKSTLAKALTTEKELVYGLDQFKEIIEVTQNNLQVRKSQTVVSYLKVIDEIQKLFLSDAKQRKPTLKKNHFSYMHKEGRCSACKGLGKQTTALDFMQDVEVVCTTCEGKRFNDKVLNFTHKGKNIAQIFDLTFKEAQPFFADNTKISKTIWALQSIGLDYLCLGQALSELSSGEKQRLKLASHLYSGAKNTLFIFDEPSIGLHPKDIEKLVALLVNLKANGNTILFVEHNPQLISIADVVVNLGKS